MQAAERTKSFIDDFLRLCGLRSTLAKPLRTGTGSPAAWQNATANSPALWKRSDSFFASAFFTVSSRAAGYDTLGLTAVIGGTGFLICAIKVSISALSENGGLPVSAK